MSGSAQVLGATCTAAGCAAVLPNTGSYRTIFMVAVAVMAVGILTLAVSSAAALARRSK